MSDQRPEPLQELTTVEWREAYTVLTGQYTRALESLREGRTANMRLIRWLMDTYRTKRVGWWLTECERYGVILGITPTELTATPVPDTRP